MSGHPDPHPLAGQTVRIRDGAPRLGGATYHVEDWWDRITGRPWMTSAGTLAVRHYMLHACLSVPLNDEVVYGQIDGYGYLVHETELSGGAP